MSPRGRGHRAWPCATAVTVCLSFPTCRGRQCRGGGRGGQVEMEGLTRECGGRGGAVTPIPLLSPWAHLSPWVPADGAPLERLGCGARPLVGGGGPCVMSGELSPSSAPTWPQFGPAALGRAGAARCQDAPSPPRGGGTRERGRCPAGPQRHPHRSDLRGRKGSDPWGAGLGVRGSGALRSPRCGGLGVRSVHINGVQYVGVWGSFHPCVRDFGGAQILGVKV